MRSLDFEVGFIIIFIFYLLRGTAVKIVGIERMENIQVQCKCNQVDRVDAESGGQWLNQDIRYLQAS